MYNLYCFGKSNRIFFFFGGGLPPPRASKSLTAEQ